jgi:hypothetical protein
MGALRAVEDTARLQKDVCASKKMCVPPKTCVKYQGAAWLANFELAHIHSRHSVMAFRRMCAMKKACGKQKGGILIRYTCIPCDLRLWCMSTRAEL